VATCLEEIERLDRVVRSLLLVARRGSVEKTGVDLERVVDERITAQGALMDARGVRARRAGGARIPANREDLGRLVDNLLRNAVEASPRGAEVTIHIEETESEVRLDFVDEGEGVPADRAAELFEPFFTCKPDGTGLGLVLSRAIVEAHEGRLTYHRGEGKTRFVVTLPLASSDGTRDVDRETAEHPDRR
jgi:signal transduction histidine kinase